MASKMEWLPISELPIGDEDDVLLYLEGGMIDIGYRFFPSDGEFICRDDEGHNALDCMPISRKATHFMRLPAAPEKSA